MKYNTAQVPVSNAADHRFHWSPTKADSHLLQILARGPVPRRPAPSACHASNWHAPYRRWPCEDRDLHHVKSRYPEAAHACTEVPSVCGVFELSTRIVSIRLVAC